MYAGNNYLLLVVHIFNVISMNPVESKNKYYVFYLYYVTLCFSL